MMLGFVAFSTRLRHRRCHRRPLGSFDLHLLVQELQRSLVSAGSASTERIISEAFPTVRALLLKHRIHCYPAHAKVNHNARVKPIINCHFSCFSSSKSKTLLNHFDASYLNFHFHQLHSEKFDQLF